MNLVPPADMVIVSKEEFFEFLRVDPRDIMPRRLEPAFTGWETPNRVVLGRSLPGWRDHGDPRVPRAYMLTEEAYAILEAARLPSAPAAVGGGRPRR